MRKGHNRSSTVPSIMNPFQCEVEFDDLTADDSIIDYCYVRDDNFMLVILLASNGSIQAYWELNKDRSHKRTKSIRSLCTRHADAVAISITDDASTVVFALSDSSVLIVPIKMLLDVNWCGGMAPSTSSSVSLSEISHLVELPSNSESCLQIPTTIVCFRTNNLPRSAAVIGNKAGDIFILDLQIRKCIVEMKAPQSVHECDIVKDGESISLLVTGCTGAQWLIPLETPGRSLWEVLRSCIPSDLKQAGSAETRLFTHHSNGVLSLNSEGKYVELHPTIPTVGSIAVKKFAIPPETWLICWTNVALFTVSKESDLRAAIHMSMNSAIRLEYTIVKGTPDWRPLALLPLPNRPNSLPSILLVNERGMVRIEQQHDVSLTRIASQFIFRYPIFSLSLIKQVASSCGLNESTLQKSLVSNIVNSRVKTNEQQQQKKPGTTAAFSAQELNKLMDIANQIKTKMEEMIDIFAANDIDEQLLPEILKKIEANRKSDLRFRVVELYCKKQRLAQNKDRAEWEVNRVDADNSLSSFLMYHMDVTEGCVLCAEVHLWKSATILAQRDNDSGRLLRYVCKNMNALRKTNHLIAHQAIGSICQLDWSVLSEKEFSDMVSLVCIWQKDLGIFTHLEILLRLSRDYAAKFQVPCEVLYFVTSLFILHEQSKETSKSIIPARILSAGLNSSVCITADHRLMIFGDFTNAQHKQIETNEIGVKRKNGESTPTNPTPPTPVKKVVQLPKLLPMEGSQPHFIVCGTEHLLLIAADGSLWAWGGNRYGQCGLGHRENAKDVERVPQAPSRILDLSGGQFHSAAVDEEGNLFTWGWNVWGQLGHGNRSTEDKLVPTKVDGLTERVRKVCCGRAHSVLLTESGRIMVAGNGSYGQLGGNDDIKKRHAFQYLDIHNHKFAHISSSFYHSVGVTETGEVFEWGRNPQEIKMKMFLMRRLRSAQLKNATESTGENRTEQPVVNKEKSAAMEKPAVLLPMEMPREDLGVREVQHMMDGTVTCIATGLSHSAIVTNNGTLYTWGKVGSFFSISDFTR
ncbi:hypothetical protein WR25_09774 [Diploscapter pachys]|uniref:Uncharacterized protein n=1 Tax=Diploscapter pachys TaxID=2018661 RepID=A0A2A2K3I6_9BILA|nr:hypothetical protein WR25_09774 [Diploscapter pachys]